jgi:hypothetical protein
MNTERLTKYQLATMAEGTKVVFAIPFSGVPAGTAGTIKENGFSEIWSAMLIAIDDPAIEADFYDDETRTIHISGGDPSSDDPTTDPSWTALSPLAKRNDDYADILAELVKCNGACLYWQMPFDVERLQSAAASGAVKEVGDLFVHPDAIEIEAGMSYSMPPDVEQMREEQDDKIIRRTNWDDPASRLALIEAVGADEYNRLLAEHHRRQTVTTVNGHAIRAINEPRFGFLFIVEGTNRAFGSRNEAEAFARSL